MFLCYIEIKLSHLKKVIKLIFCGKNETQVSGSANAKKGPRPWKKFFKKKFLPACLSKYYLQIGVQNFFWNKWVSWYLNFDGLMFQKIVPHNKIINKTWSKFRTSFWRQLSHESIFYRIGLNPEALELLEYALVITFFKKILLVRVF